MRGYGADMHYLAQMRRGQPRQLLPEARTVLVAVAPHTRREGATSPLTGEIAEYALGDDYHVVLRERLLELAAWLCSALGKPLTARPCVDTAPLLERALAQRAGVSFTGKSTLSIVPGVGSGFLLAELLLDVELPTATIPIADGCGRCTRCLDACPTQAFVGPYVLDARRCVSYLTIENKQAIPRELRAQIGARVFGCDACQSVCPYNETRKRPEPINEFRARPHTDPAPLIELLELTSGAYRRWTKHSALRRTTRVQLQRNAAVALGNVAKDDSEACGLAVAALVRSLRVQPSALVREHVAWALGRIGDSCALSALQQALQTEQDPQVRKEIAQALQDHAEGEAAGGTNLVRPGSNDQRV